MTPEEIRLRHPVRVAEAEPANVGARVARWFWTCACGEPRERRTYRSKVLAQALALRHHVDPSKTDSRLEE